MSPKSDNHARADQSREVLDECLARFNPDAAIEVDPLGIVYEMPPSWHELSAHIAAGLAYGRASLIRRSVRRVLQALHELNPDPDALLDSWQPGLLQSIEPSFVYRMTRVEDLDAFISGLAQLRRAHGGLEAAFVSMVQPSDPDLHAPLGRYFGAIRELSGEAERRGVRYLTPDGSTGSASKRGHLMLRWLVRGDAPDLGIWRQLSSADLVMPLDTHIAWLSRAIGLTSRKTADYKMAREITDHFARWAPQDPLCYDMALCHVGLTGDCNHSADPDNCPRCPLQKSCSVGRLVQPDT